jgi:hypothetical protein
MALENLISVTFTEKELEKLTQGIDCHCKKNS